MPRTTCYEHGRRHWRGGDREDLVPPVSKVGGIIPASFSVYFDFCWKVIEIISISLYFKIKWPESAEKINFGGRKLSLTMSPSPPPLKLL